MTPEEHGDILKYEQSVNERYLKRASGRDGPNPVVEKAVATTPGARMTDTAPTAPKVGGRIGPLIGRVALNPHDAGLGQTFYIGYRYTVLDDATVLSWGAGASRLFFEGRSAAASSPEAAQPRTVAARRSFRSSLDQLVNFEDDIEEDGTGTGPDPEVHFPRAAPLAVPPPPTPRPPAPPAPRSRPDPHRSVSQPPSVDSKRSERGSTSLPRGTEGPTETASTPSADRKDAADRMRAAHLLDEAIKAPKAGALSPVLATLQPEQYRLVTRPADQNLLVKGHPGTGKTIVAAHRAAWLVLPKDQDRHMRLSRVALVGPTDRWKRHIQPTVMELAHEGVEVLSLESLVRDWSRVARQRQDTPTEKELHSRWAIGRIADRAARSQKRRLSQFKRAERVRELVNSLVQDTEAHRRFVLREDSELSEWLLDAGDYQNARRDPSYLLFLAAAGTVTGWRQPAHSDRQHIVVDEAQDLRPVEWWMLSKMFRAGTEERWSVFGDMNQRRSDFTWTHWESLADLLELSDPHSEQLPEPVDLHNGYRSTRQILSYAGALLPRGERANHALRNGPEPSVRQVGPKQAVSVATEAAERLTIRYHQGSVAVIAYRPEIVERIERMLRGPDNRRGWSKDADGSLRRDHRGCRLSVVRPVEARGLEYDAVVVVEPADFKPNLGRHGELYTSLTRANHELVVIHSKAMPKELRGRGDRVRG